MQKLTTITVFTLSIVFIVSNLLLIPSSTTAAPPPLSPTSTKLAPKLGTSSLPPLTPPAPTNLPPEVERARAKESMEGVVQKYLQYWGPRYQVDPINVILQGEWAYGVASWKSATTLFKDSIYVLAHRSSNGTWQALLPSSDGLYAKWLDQIPEEILSVNAKSQARAQASQVDALRRPIGAPVLQTPVSPAVQLNKAQVSQTPKPISSQSPLTMTQTPQRVPINSTPTAQPQTWISGETDFSKLSHEELQKLVRLPAQVIEWERVQASRELPKISARYGYPTAIDWRNMNGQDWTTGIRNQASCGSCVAFGTIGAIESRMEIAKNNANLNPDLSEAHLFFCNGANCANGWYPNAAMDAARNTGIVDEGCYPYTDSQQTCNPCADWQNRVTKISNWTGTSTVADMKQALADGGPFEATMTVYYDFFNYAGGIYRHTSGSLAGYHAITIVGYNDLGGYWIAKNSWGTGWGEDKYGNPNGGGWFRIAYDQEIASYAYIPFVSSTNDTTPPDGDYTSPASGATVGQIVHLAAWASDSGSGVKEVHFTAKWNNEWHLVYNDTSAPYEYDWDLCAANVPNGDIELGLDIYDYAGNVFHLHLKHANPHITKNYTCTICSPNANQVSLYANANYGGSCVTLDLGNYPTPGYLGSLGNDNAESIKVGSNVKATVCENDNYQGRCETFTSDDANLADNYIGANVISSMQVQQRNQAPPPPNLVAPGNGNVYPESASFTLFWDSASGATEYLAEYWGGPAGTQNSGWRSGTAWYIGSQWAGYVYSWHVKARNSVGESNWSNTWTFTVKPAAPTNLSVQTVSCSQNNLYWNDNSGNEEGYKIYRNSSMVAQVGANSTSYQDTGRSGNTSYAYSVTAFRGSIESDASNTVNVTTPPCVSSKPDLAPTQWAGWQYPIVPSSVSNTTVVNTLYAGYSTFIDWGLSNIGNADTVGNTYGELYIDSTRLARYDFGNVTPGQAWAFLDWHETINNPGWHTLRVIVDPENLIAESDETNNMWERQFYWQPAAPYSDNMENGTNDWSATGLWHQVSSASPYPSYLSPMHSWWYGQDTTGNFDTGSANSGDLTSPSIYIPTTGYYLQFWYQYETETATTAWDKRWLQISLDGGSFSNVLQLYDDPMNRWLKSQVIDVSSYAGHSIRVRFHFETIDGAFNNFRGWYIDDFSISTTPPPACADTHEPNNTPTQAMAIAYNQTLTGDICPGGDYDFYKFTGVAGDKVVLDIDAKVNGSSLDSYIYLIDSDGNTTLAENDDEILYQVQDAKMGYQLTHDGIYYIKVKAWNHPSVGGTAYSYSMRLMIDIINPSAAAITSPLDNTWLNPLTTTIQATATDSPSGVNRVEFLWHSADWQNSNWVWLGADKDGRDGWSFNLDTSSQSEQRGGAFYIWAFDWANNWTGAGVWNLGIDRTPPFAVAHTSFRYGNAQFRDFNVYWDGSDNLSWVTSYDIQYRDGVSGTWTDLLTGTTNTLYRFVGQDNHTYYFRARARDQAGNQSAYATGNGDASHTVSVCAISPDSYESDNAFSNARLILTNGTRQTHNIHADGDQDWVKFSATSGISYTLTTNNTGGYADTVLYLYNTDGSTLIASNDDYSGMGYASRVDWRPSVNGIYYAMVKHWDPYAYGCTTVYGLTIIQNGSPPSNLLFLPYIKK